MNNLNSLLSSIVNYISLSQGQRDNREFQNSSEEEDRVSQAIALAFSNIAIDDNSTKKKKAPDSEQEGPTSLKKRKIASKTEQIKNEIEEISIFLDRWVNASSPNENRSEARERIMNFLEPMMQNPTLSERIMNFLQPSNMERKLNLADLNLSELPDIFGYEVLIHNLTKLDLMCNQLAALPESIGNLIKLTELDLSGNKLEALPGSIGNLINLTGLALSYNKLAELPGSIGNLINLTRLALSYNQLAALPESIRNLIKLTKLYLAENKLTELPESIGNLTNLTELDLNNNTLVALPGSIGDLINLTGLNLNNNKLVALPGSIGDLTHLKKLDLYFNQLEALPESIGNLINLTWLNLMDNETLAGLPDTVLNLPSGCRVELTGTGLSESILRRLREASAAEGYQGPTFSYSMREHEQGDDKPLEEVLKEMYALLKKEVPAFPDLDKRVNMDTLSSWLNRISYIGDYNAKGDIQKALVEKTLSFIEKAYENAEFAEVFSSVIDGAAATCGDRMALSIVHLGLAYDLSQMGTSNLPMLGKFLVNTVWVIEILEECARNKIPSLHFFDEIEVYLGYIVKLKDRLNFSIAVEDMLYFHCSALSEEGLSIAENIVREKLASDEKYEYLIKNDKWIEALREQFPDKMEQINEARYADYENNPENLQMKYKAALIDLSKEVYKK